MPTHQKPLDERLEMDFLEPNSLFDEREIDIDFLREPQQGMISEPIFHGVPLNELDSLSDLTSLTTPIDFSTSTSETIPMQQMQPIQPFQPIQQIHSSRRQTHRKSRNPFSNSSIARGIRSLKQVFTKKRRAKKRKQTKRQKKAIIF